jgi:HD domain
MNQLTDQFAEAVGFAIEVHEEQVRKGTDITYVSHLLAVSALVLEHGGDEELAIAGLLHDAVEDGVMEGADYGESETMEERIRDEFGDRVADVVVGCSDTDVVPKPPWRERKERYIADLLDARPEVLLVSACDKLHNARCTVANLREQGPSFWAGFNAEPADQRWYYATLLDVFRRRFADNPARRRLLAELERTIGELTTLVDNSALSDWPAELGPGRSGTTCPSCGEGDAHPIIWGMPSPELMEAVQQGLIDVALGGCCVTEDDPTHVCRACGLQFREARSPTDGC